MADSKFVTPFLLDFATRRDGEPSIGGRYCPDRQVWVIHDGVHERPIVETRLSGAQLQTKTRVLAEEDDEECGALLELVTKTKVNAEEDDDEAVEGLVLHELAIKTYVAVESDEDDEEETGWRHDAKLPSAA